MHQPLPKLFAATVIAAFLITACAPSPVPEPPTTRIVAVAPFVVSQSLLAAPARFANTSPQSVSQRLSTQVAETLRSRGLSVFSAHEVRDALAESGIRLEPATALPPETARVVAEKLGANALLIGELRRWSERQGSAIGATRGATVTLGLTLFDAPGGHQLWSASFDRTQLPLSENVLQAGQLPGGGTRWLTAEELALWGAGHTARQMPLQ